MPSNATKSRAAKRAAAKARAEAAKKARLEAAAAQDAPKPFDMLAHFKDLPTSAEALEDYQGFESGSLQHLWIRRATLKAGFRAQSDSDATYIDFFGAAPELRASIISDMHSHHEVGHTIGVADDVVNGDAGVSRQLAIASVKRAREDGTLVPTDLDCHPDRTGPVIATVDAAAFDAEGKPTAGYDDTAWTAIMKLPNPLVVERQEAADAELAEQAAA